MWPVAVVLNQTGLDRIVPNVGEDSLVLLVRPGPVVEPFALPEGLAVCAEELGGLMARLPFEVLQGVLEAGINVDEQLELPGLVRVSGLLVVPHLNAADIPPLDIRPRPILPVERVDVDVREGGS
jgi:hypothetical protein